MISCPFLILIILIPFFLFALQKSSNLSDITNGTPSSNEPPIKDAPKSAPSTGSSSVPQEPSSVPQEPSSVQNHHSSNSTDGPLAPHNSKMLTAPGQAPPKTEVSISRLSCYFCKRQFRSKPQLLSHQVCRLHKCIKSVG